MSTIKITVGDDGDKAADGGRQLAFGSWEVLARVLTGKRLELRRYARRHKTGSLSRRRWVATAATSTPTSGP